MWIKPLKTFLTSMFGVKCCHASLQCSGFFFSNYNMQSLTAIWLDDECPVLWTSGFKIGEMLQNKKKNTYWLVMSVVMGAGSKGAIEWIWELASENSFTVHASSKWQRSWDWRHPFLSSIFILSSFSGIIICCFGLLCGVCNISI